jgi:nitronate monooxygenase
MLHTYLTDEWGLRYPILGAPMANVAHGRLAHAISEAGGLGMIGIGFKDSPEMIERESSVARGSAGSTKFGIGLMAWAIEIRRELLDAAIRERPFVLAISFGSLAPYADEVHGAGILLATQVNNRRAAVDAAKAGADLIIAQGTESGGHTGHASTLPLLQIVLDSVDVPVAAAGGIASPAGLAAVLAAGANGGWLGTPFLLSPEAEVTDAARERITKADETQTILTSVFDRANKLPWPAEFPGRALRNSFAAHWHGHEDELLQNEKELARFRTGAEARDYDVTSIYAGQAVGLLSRRRTAQEIVRDFGEGAERHLRENMAKLLG